MLATVSRKLWCLIRKCWVASCWDMNISCSGGQRDKTWRHQESCLVWSVRLQFLTWSHHSSVRVWPSLRTSLYLSFLIYKTGTMTAQHLVFFFWSIYVCAWDWEHATAHAWRSKFNLLVWDRVFCSVLLLTPGWLACSFLGTHLLPLPTSP